MEIDKKIIKKLIEVLEDLKKSLNEKDIINIEKPIEEKIIESSIPSLIIVVLCVIGVVFMSKINNQLFKSGERQ